MLGFARFRSFAFVRRKTGMYAHFRSLFHSFVPFGSFCTHSLLRGRIRAAAGMDITYPCEKGNDVYFLRVTMVLQCTGGAKQ